jgi:hypothetical protein
MPSAAKGVRLHRPTPTVNARPNVPSASMVYLSSVPGLSTGALDVGGSSSHCGATVMEYYCGG